MSVLRVVGVTFSLLVVMVLMPGQFGGPATYVTTYGNSMEPHMHAGDLVVARAQSAYNLGDVVAFRSETVNAVVLHRIVESRDDGTFITKGDNNTWLDPDVISKADILGSQWIFIPNGGVWLAWFTAPAVLGGMAFLLAILFVGVTVRYGSDRAKARRHNMGTAKTQFLGVDRESWIARRHELLVGAAVLGTLGLAVSVMGWAQPTTVATETSQTTTDTVNFSYYATVPPTPAYQDTKVVAPDPVFRRLTNEIVVEYSYTGTPGSVVTDLHLATTTGWTWRMPQAEPVSATSGTAQHSIRLDLDAIEQLANAGTQAAGIALGSITINVAPLVTTESGTFEPVLSLTMDKDKVTLSDGNQDALTVTQETSDPALETQPNHINFWFLTLGVWSARIVGLLLLAVAGVVAWWAWRLPRPDVRAHLAASEKRLGHMVVPAAYVEEVEPVVDVTGLEALATIARRYALVILHVHQPSGDTYYVRDAQTTYRWMAPPPVRAEPKATNARVIAEGEGAATVDGVGFAPISTLN